MKAHRAIGGTDPFILNPGPSCFTRCERNRQSVENAMKRKGLWKVWEKAVKRQHSGFTTEIQTRFLQNYTPIRFFACREECTLYQALRSTHTEYC